MDISIIIPVYFNEGSIEKTYIILQDDILSTFSDLEFEIIFIDDGSSDNTLKIIKDIAGKDSACRIISFSRNFGHEAATSAGIQHCSGDIAFIIDADLQDPPELFPEMINDEVLSKIQSYKDAVLGWKLSGAGGGGYLVVVSEKAITGSISIKIRRP